jgi:hypothetical protein
MWKFRRHRFSHDLRLGIAEAEITTVTAGEQLKPGTRASGAPRASGLLRRGPGGAWLRRRA